VDLAGAAGADVLAAGAGTVSFAGRVAGRGVVTVTHDHGLRTTYEPVDAAVARGDPVQAGAVLGSLAAGASHCAPAACLHLGALWGDVYVDPLALVRERPYPVLLPAPPP
jgi:murein DD-endopeptidase MepM/ murein hydrolase activator NlpD